MCKTYMKQKLLHIIGIIEQIRNKFNIRFQRQYLRMQFGNSPVLINNHHIKAENRIYKTSCIVT